MFPRFLHGGYAHELCVVFIGLYPADDLDAAKCDAVMDCGTDLSGNVRPSMLEKDDEKKVRAVT